MGIIADWLVGYGLVAAFVAARLGLHMATRLDRFDWEADRVGIWTTFVLSAALWPLFLFRRPKHLLDPSPLFEDESKTADRLRKREYLRRFPPACSTTIRYQSTDEDGVPVGEFLFSAATVERVLSERVRKHPRLRNGDDGEILAWVHRRDEELKPTNVPNEWSRFIYVADELIRLGNVEATCLKCGQRVPTDRLVPEDDRGKTGLNYNRLRCPNGHLLLKVQTLHISRKTVSG